MNEDTENNQIDQVEKIEVVETEQPVYMSQYWVDPQTNQPCQMMKQ